MSRKAIFASDLHGNRFAYEQVFAIAEREGITTVIFGGDLTPKWPIINFGPGGACVPLDPEFLRRDQNGLTYTDFLARMRELMGGNQAVAERRFVRRGGYVTYTGGTTIKWPQLIKEQELLKRLLDFFAAGKFSLLTAETLILTAEEWSTVVALLAASGSESREYETLMTMLRWITISRAERERVLEWFRETQRVLAAWPHATQQYLAHKGIAMLLAGEGSVPGPDLGVLRSTVGAATATHVLADAVEGGQNLLRAMKAQQQFIQQYLNKLFRSVHARQPGIRIFFILGNDDVLETVPMAESLDAHGFAMLLHGRRADLGNGLSIVGYPHVPRSGKFYDGWEKPEDEIARDLAALDAAGDPERTVYVVHCPPLGTSLDASFGGQHFGSSAVHDWLRNGRKHAVMSGHIHEAPFVPGGSWRETVHGTPCIQPGAFHGEDLCAAVFDLDNPSDAKWVTPISGDAL